MRLGDELYFGNYQDESTRNYRDALSMYMKAHAFNPNSSELNFKIGICHLNGNHKEKALDFLLSAYELRNQVDRKINYYLGIAYHVQYQFDKAIQRYEYYRKILNQKNEIEEIYDVNKKIEECRTGKEMYNNPVRVWIDNLGEQINGDFGEYAPLIAADESRIFFTSRRPDTEGGGKEADWRYFEDIYFAQKVDGEWQPAVNLGTVVNSKSHDATSRFVSRW